MKKNLPRNIPSSVSEVKMSHSESPLALKNFPFDQLLSKDKRGLTSKNFSVPFKLSFKVVITQISASSILDYQARRLSNKWSFLIRFHFMLMTDVLCLIVLIAESQRYFLPLWHPFLWVIMFENHQKCLIWIFHQFLSY